MTLILNCDLCGRDAGDDPYHATVNGNGHVHICVSCFDPQQHDVAVIKKECQQHLTEKTTALFEKLEALDLARSLNREKLALGLVVQQLLAYDDMHFFSSRDRVRYWEGMIKAARKAGGAA